MKIVLINPPHTAIGSRVPDDHLPPLGLLALGGPLLDAGHQVRLVDAEFGPMPLPALVEDALGDGPDCILIGHSGSTSAHPTALQIARMVKGRAPATLVIYGGVFPTYHWRDILAGTEAFDVIVRGEGEATIVSLIEALDRRRPLADVAGIAYRDDLGRPFATRSAGTIATLDDYRVGWELIDHRRHSYWGGKRAVVMQFSRGCPHLCNYCGQRGFWTRWRHRDPKNFAREIAWLHREHGVELINLADENPTSSKKAWRAFLDAMIAEDVPVLIVGSTRADDIVRDADILHLYRKAGVIRWLLGMENTDEETLSLIRKGGSTASDREAIRLLRQHGILSMATWVAGFEDEGFRDLWRGFRQLIAYDPDQIQALYVTPHRWTPFFRIAKDRTVIQSDVRLWDYKHQVLRMTRLKPWMLFFSVKLIELAVQSRPKALARILFHRDPEQRHSMRWYTKMGRRVWFREVWGFLARDRRVTDGPTLAEFWGAPQDAEEESMVVMRPPRKPAEATVAISPGA
ncbi:magnesium-protoporphyrin IX monomethyl ester anaerobic oxidative cyclase [Mesorhizobium sp. M4B.F.Ca.ET.190.01.1.1]|uniref:magnesium-protoporphyrin IX monomethyl ester anaerobic oxidative cyclase n=1 Tax=unclassified Mesorhizobium TaxID=325217 RepID=UPI000FE8BF92|nr:MULTISPECIES: magnesium-protoporphyrin IX monomethyl ester anaerobic oxidative cyclase [unclassified Mesorhizobium]RWA61303.1 MAG: magnesium-protoporphyrin IX monomethyl ester anaerobic oxidative cyclase [Mesorhizobium sp.]RWF62913.1 MAG: magnesium-protoporphyrin IX monomethyl ester anaerobic oxidative cyclase [Mesorhizobium sp.]TGR08846.1 magnesium-protoporphyrin IX monomethyl ester anaerobic oxidative cyclase [Mesorhizobium sp. M4B.F.Ca.ET.200.01.1.1]TGS18323.1 magnesium-protoporphyrin IX 